jgi:hypothetical protein
MRLQRTLQLFGLTIIALAGGLGAQAQAGQTVDFGPAPPPLSRPFASKLMANPGLLNETKKHWSQGSSAIAPAPLPGAASPAGGTWTSGNRPSGNPNLSNPLLLTDGTVIAHVSCTGTWWKLTPDNTGSYVNGTWSTIASLPSGYTPRFFGSAVLTDGKVVIEGGEYNSGCGAQWTTLGSIYDPVANTWTSISPPSGWTTIGDAQAIVLTNGTYLQANCCSTQAALLNESTLSWTSTGTGKYDVYDEEGWTLLPSGKVLTVDAYVSTGTCGQGSEVYDPSTGAWSSAGNVGVQLADCSNPGNSRSYEMGPHVLRPDGTVVAFGGTLCSDAANSSCASGTLSTVTYTGIYNAGSGSWSVGPAIPAISGRNYSLADAPAALLPNGNTLFAASPNYQGFVAPTHFFEFDTSNTISQVADPTDYASFTSYEWNFVVLPTGQILAVETDGSNVWYYNPTGTYSSSWQPVISALSNYTLSGGSTYQISGAQLNGLSEGAAYGDDVQAATNYPIVRITNNGTGHVFFAKTFGNSTRSIAPSATSSSIENGASTLVAIANGIPSQPVSVTVGTNNNYTLSVSVNGNPGGTVTSSPSGINCGSTCSKSFTAGTQVTLSSTSDQAWGFFGWGGACSGLANTCTVTLNADTSVSALFGTLFSAEQVTLPTPGATPLLPPALMSAYPQPPSAF